MIFEKRLCTTRLCGYVGGGRFLFALIARVFPRSPVICTWCVVCSSVLFLPRSVSSFRKRWFFRVSVCQSLGLLLPLYGCRSKCNAEHNIKKMSFEHVVIAVAATWKTKSTVKFTHTSRGRETGETATETPHKPNQTARLPQKTHASFGNVFCRWLHDSHVCSCVFCLPLKPIDARRMSRPSCACHILTQTFSLTFAEYSPFTVDCPCYSQLFSLCDRKCSQTWAQREHSCDSVEEEFILVNGFDPPVRILLLEARFNWNENNFVDHDLNIPNSKNHGRPMCVVFWVTRSYGIDVMKIVTKFLARLTIQYLCILHYRP